MRRGSIVIRAERECASNLFSGGLFVKFYYWRIFTVQWLGFYSEGAFVWGRGFGSSFLTCDLLCESRVLFLPHYAVTCVISAWHRWNLCILIVAQIFARIIFVGIKGCARKKACAKRNFKIPAFPEKRNDPVLNANYSSISFSSKRPSSLVTYLAVTLGHPV